MLCTPYERQVQQYKADSTRLTERHLVQWWKDHLGAVPIRMIQPFLINEHILLLMQDKQNPTVKKYMNVLSSILKFAVEQGIIERNPITTMRKPKILKPKVRFLDDEERKKLLQTAKTDMNPRMYPALVLSLLKNDTRGE
jgi:site-specific recombinase XerD